MSSASAVHSMFSRIAKTYDLANDGLSFGIHRRWKARLVREAQVPVNARVLDVATGTGDLAFRFAAAFPSPRRIVGADFCAPMLDIARERHATEAPSSAVEFIEADALALPFPDNSFDVVSCAFGVRNFGDAPRALKEMWRVLAPGGKMLILEFGDWSTQTGPLRFFHSVARVALPWMGGKLSGDAQAYRYLLESSEVFPAGQRFLPWLEGLPSAQNARATPLAFGVAWLYLVERGVLALAPSSQETQRSDGAPLTDAVVARVENR